MSMSYFTWNKYITSLIKFNYKILKLFLIICLFPIHGSRRDKILIFLKFNYILKDRGIWDVTKQLWCVSIIFCFFFPSKREHPRPKPLNQPLTSIINGSTDSMTELRESPSNLGKCDIMLHVHVKNWTRYPAYYYIFCVRVWETGEGKL